LLTKSDQCNCPKHSRASKCLDGWMSAGGWTSFLGT